MVYDDSNEQVNRFARGIIRRKIKQIIGRAGFKTQDGEDLEQELILRLLQRWPFFNPNVAHRNVFTTTVIERFVATILRDKQAEKRDHRRVTSLNVTVNIGEDETAELADTISQRELDAQRGRSLRRDEELAQLRQDLAEIIAKLPEKLKALAERLKTETVSEIARDMGVPRTTLDGWVRWLRQRFENAGLKDYI
jgi:RNA polymerase sigma-70 factor (ECF subfamily)